MLSYGLLAIINKNDKPSNSSLYKCVAFVYSKFNVGNKSNHIRTHMIIYNFFHFIFGFLSFRLNKDEMYCILYPVDKVCTRQL